jgi:uncharacterized protein YbaR (Trm112 family)
MNEYLLNILCCPSTRQSLRPATEEELIRFRGMDPAWEEGLVTEDGRRAYPVRGGLPILLIDAARELTS